MKNEYKVYLAGAISGLTYNEGQDWRDLMIHRLLSYDIVGYSPLRAKSYLKDKGKIEQSYSEHPLSTDHGITYRDRYDIESSDLVFFNLLGSLSRVSIGTCIEFGWADAYRKPIVLLMEPKDNIHDHPMIRDITGFRVTSYDEAIYTITRILLP